MASYHYSSGTFFTVFTDATPWRVFRNFYLQIPFLSRCYAIVNRLVLIWMQDLKQTEDFFCIYYRESGPPQNIIVTIRQLLFLEHVLFLWLISI